MRIETKPCEYGLGLDTGRIASVDHRDNVDGSAHLTRPNV
jgi:hypothetical protein